MPDNTKAAIRGPYKQWDIHEMEAALQEIAEAGHVKAIGQKVNVHATAEKWGIP